MCLAVIWHRAVHEGPVIDCAYVDNGEVIAIGEDGNLCVLPCGGGPPAAVYCADATLSAFAIAGNRRAILAGDVHGGAHMLELQRPRPLAVDGSCERLRPSKHPSCEFVLPHISAAFRVYRDGTFKTAFGALESRSTSSPLECP